MEKSIVPVDRIAVRSSTCYEFSNPNEAEVVELEDDPVDVMERNMDYLKLDHQFKEDNVPLIFQTLINKKNGKLEEIGLNIDKKSCEMRFDDIEVFLEKEENDWLISYERSGKTFETDDLEKSIVDHLWFVLKNPKLKLEDFEIEKFNDIKSINSPVDSERLGLMLQTMFDSLDHLVHISKLSLIGLNENVLLSFLPHIKPGVLDEIFFEISWKEKGNYQKLEEIAEMDQWKQAKSIFSTGATSLTVNDVLHCETALLLLPPEDVPSVKKKYFNSADSVRCSLHDKNHNSPTIIASLRDICEILSADVSKKFYFQFAIIDKHLILSESEDSVVIRKI